MNLDINIVSQHVLYGLSVGCAFPIGCMIDRTEELSLGFLIRVSFRGAPNNPKLLTFEQHRLSGVRLGSLGNDIRARVFLKVLLWFSY